MATSQDRDLVVSARGGSRAAQATLVRRHWRSAWQRAYAITGRRAAADDIAQDAVATALSRLADLDDPAAFPAWLGRIATRRALDLLRSERRLVELDGIPEPAVEWTGPLGDAEDVRQAVAALAPERRAVIVLRYWLELTPAEIAESAGLPVGTVNSRLSRALADLRQALEEHSRA